MNINPIIEQAFDDFKVDDLLIPIATIKYTGNASTYLTYYTWLNQPEGFSDDKPFILGTYGTIDVYSKDNFKKIVKEVVKKLEEIGFTWTGNDAEIYEENTGLFHVPINFYIEANELN